MSQSQVEAWQWIRNTEHCVLGSAAMINRYSVLASESSNCQTVI